MCWTYVLLVAHVKYFNGNGVKVKQEFVEDTKNCVDLLSWMVCTAMLR